MHIVRIFKIYLLILFYIVFYLIFLFDIVHRLIQEIFYTDALKTELPSLYMSITTIIHF